jgi:hypothetical protein
VWWVQAQVEELWGKEHKALGKALGGKLIVGLEIQTDSEVRAPPDRKMGRLVDMRSNGKGCVCGAEIGWRWVTLRMFCAVCVGSGGGEGGGAVDLPRQEHRRDQVCMLLNQGTSVCRGNCGVIVEHAWPS